jgi:hypothetical protein
MHDYEVAAQSKADRIAPIIWQQIQQRLASDSHSAGGSASGSSEAGGSTGSNGAQYPQQWLNFCQTQWGVCAIPSAIGYRGAACSCRTQTEEHPGMAY